MKVKSKIWDGRPLLCDGSISFDCETTIVGPNQYPKLIAMSCSNNVDTFVIRPDQISDWVHMVVASGCPIVAHNAAFDFLVVDHHLEYLEDSREWRKILDEGRLWDTMILDFLVRLAGGVEEGPLRMRSLADLAKFYLNVDLDKNLQTKWGIYENAPFNLIPEEYLDYAIADAKVTRELFNELMPTANHICGKYKTTLTAEEYGPLTHHLQVKASVALAEVSRNGIAISSKLQKQVAAELQKKIEHSVQFLIDNFPNIFVREKVKSRQGQLILNPRTRIPKIDNNALRDYLLQVASEYKLKPKDIPLTDKSKEITISATYWEQFQDHDFVESWLSMKEQGKLLNFVLDMSGDAIHPRYQTIVRTGRTSCSGPNLQQMPKAEWFRKMFVPRTGCKFVIADYKAIELRCLGAICKACYGFSSLADTFEAGIDPHSYTAASLLNMDYSQFMKMKEADKKSYEKARFAAKAVNFGVPGGLGARALAAYAETTYGVTMSLNDAREWRNTLITKTYPELSRYLSYDPVSNLVINLHTSIMEYAAVLGVDSGNSDVLYGFSQVVSGRAKDSKGRPYSTSYRRWVWECLTKLNKNPNLELLIRSRRGSDSLRRQLFGGTVITLTGRIRGSAEYTETCNTQFQGLASDGAKLALYEISKIYPIVVFVHDEIVVEIPDDKPEVHKNRVVKLMNSCMDKVLLGYCKSETEAIIADHWCKG